MNSTKAIGGYFELELSSGGFLHDDAILLNSGRNCLAYILEATQPKHVHMPKFTCDVMFEPLKKQGIAYSLYDVDEQLELSEKLALAKDELLVFTNYFGVKDEYCRSLSRTYGESLVLDCSQAWFCAPLDKGYTFYSPRKFFGVADGGCLVSSLPPRDLPLDTSYQRMSHLLKRIDLGPEAGYGDFKQNDGGLSGEPLKQMSLLTRKLLGSIDADGAQVRRRQNFTLLHRALGVQNRLHIDESTLSTPLCYPFFTEDLALRQKLIDQKIFVATYWPNVLQDYQPTDPANYLAQHILPLPIDQRYDERDMQRMLEVIL